MTDELNLDWRNGGLAPKETSKAKSLLNQKLGDERQRRLDSAHDAAQEQQSQPSPATVTGFDVEQGGYVVRTKGGEVIAESLTSGALPRNPDTDAGVSDSPTANWKPATQTPFAPNSRVQQTTGYEAWILHRVDRPSYYTYYVGGPIAPVKLADVPKKLPRCDTGPLPPPFPRDKSCVIVYGGSAPWTTSGAECAIDYESVFYGGVTQCGSPLYSTSTGVPVPEGVTVDIFSSSTFLISSDGYVISRSLEGTCIFYPNPEGKEGKWLVYNIEGEWRTGDGPFTPLNTVWVKGVYSWDPNSPEASNPPYPPNDASPDSPVGFPTPAGDWQLISHNCSIQCGDGLPPPEPGYYDRSNPIDAVISSPSTEHAYVSIRWGQDCETGEPTDLLRFKIFSDGTLEALDTAAADDWRGWGSGLVQGSPPDSCHLEYYSNPMANLIDGEAFVVTGELAIEGGSVSADRFTLTPEITCSKELLESDTADYLPLTPNPEIVGAAIVV